MTGLIGSEFLLSTGGSGELAEHADIAALADGRFVAVYEGLNIGGDSQVVRDVNLQLFTADGDKVGFHAGVTEGAEGVDAQTDATVAALSDGRFVVSWGEDSGFHDPVRFDVMARVFGVDRLPDTQAFSVTGAVANGQVNPTLTGLDNGQFMVGWEDDGPNELHARTFRPDGVAAAPERSITEWAGEDAGPALAQLANGNVVAAWRENRFTTDDRAVKAQLLTRSGRNIGEEIELPGTTGSGVFGGPARIAALSSGGFAIAYLQTTLTNTGSGFQNDWALYVQFLSAAGNPRGEAAEIRSANGLSPEFQFASFDYDIVELGEGGVALAWSEREGESFQETDRDVFVQIVSPRGGLAGDPIRVNESRAEDQSSPTLATNDAGRTIIAYTDADPAPGGSQSAVVGRELEGPDSFRHGTSGDDVMAGRGRDDAIFAEGGDDTVFGQGGDDFIHGGRGADFLVGGYGADLIEGGAGADELRGGNRGDILRGGEGGDILRGLGGRDRLEGGPGDDTLAGGDAADILHGGPGNDLLAGNAGRSEFVYEAPNFGRDHIRGFVDGVDDLDIRGLVENHGVGYEDILVRNTPDGARVTFDGVAGAIFLQGMAAADVDAGDFLM